MQQDRPGASLRTVLVADVGGTKLAAAVVTNEGTLLAEEQIATPRSDGAEHLFATLERLLRRVLAASGVRVSGLGVGCAGPMRYPEGVVSPLNMPAWRDFPLRARLSAAFDGAPCVVDNDAKAVALGEQWQGAGQGSRNMIGMVVSTGVGAGVILDGRLLHGEHGNAGHLGHVIVWPGGPACACGARGCVEAIASGTSLARRFAEAVAAGATSDLPAGATGAQIAAAARGGDALARQLFDDAGRAVGRGIASAAALLDLEVVAIGGSVALQSWDLLGPPLEAELRQSAHLHFTRELRVTRAALGQRAGLLGAAVLGFSALAD